MDYSTLIEDGELSDLGIDFAVEVSNGERDIPQDLPSEIRRLIQEALEAMGLALVGALDNG